MIKIIWILVLTIPDTTCDEIYKIKPIKNNQGIYFEDQGHFHTFTRHLQLRTIVNWTKFHQDVQEIASYLKIMIEAYSNDPINCCDFLTLINSILNSFNFISHSFGTLPSPSNSFYNHSFPLIHNELEMELEGIGKRFDEIKKSRPTITNNTYDLNTTTWVNRVNAISSVSHDLCMFIQEILNDSKNNILNHRFIKTEKLSSIINQDKLFMEISNLNLTTIYPIVQRKILSIIIQIPLFSYNPFSLFKIHKFPVLNANQTNFYSIESNYSHIAVNLRGSEYFFPSKFQLNNCSKEYCLFSPRTFSNNSCEKSLILNPKYLPKQYCNLKLVPFRSAFWIDIKPSNEWIFSTSIINITLLCPPKIYSLTIQGIGILKLFKTCTIIESLHTPTIEFSINLIIIPLCTLCMIGIIFSIVIVKPRFTKKIPSPDIYFIASDPNPEIEITENNYFLPTIIHTFSSFRNSN